MFIIIKNDLNKNNNVKTKKIESFSITKLNIHLTNKDMDKGWK